MKYEFELSLLGKEDKYSKTGKLITYATMKSNHQVMKPLANKKNDHKLLKKTQFYGGNGGDYFDDWELINERFLGHEIKEIKIKEFEIFYRPNLIFFINFTYQIITDQGVFKQKGNSFGKKGNHLKEGKLFNHFFSDDETIKEITFNDYFWALKVINGVQIKTNKNNFSFGVVGDKLLSVPENNFLVVHGKGSHLVDGLGFYFLQDFSESNEEKEGQNSTSFSKDCIEKWEKNDFDLEEIKNWEELGFGENDYIKAKNWRDLMGYQETKKWLSLGLGNEKYQLAYYWKKFENNLPNNEEELRLLEKKDVSFENWINLFYPQKGLCIVDNSWYGWENNKGKKRNEITQLSLSSNNLSGEIDLSDFVNLQRLSLGDNYGLKGSLFQLESLDKIKYLDINSTNFESGLEYLSPNLEVFYCANTKLIDELSFYNHNLITWQIAHSQSMESAGKKVKKFSYSGEKLLKTITTPLSIIEKKDKEIESKENKELSNLDYKKFALRDKHDFNWKNIELTPNSLPLRLYNLKTDKVEESSELSKNTNYLILSYCWGIEWENTPQSYGQKYLTDLTRLGRKSLKKVKKFYNNHPDINYVWIDNFCINQNDNEEKSREVRKQKQYYSNSTATLISIDGEVGNKFNKTDNKIEFINHLLKTIVDSVWFTRSWTFQEGLLSKQTVFMFDDYLVDGRMLSLFWGAMQQENHYMGKIETKSDNLTIHVTPIGWSHGSQPSHSINLTLGEALLAVSNRSQTVPIDGIYSVLGLLPYGDKVVATYKDKICKECKDIEKRLDQAVFCDHSVELRTEYSTYFQEDLKNALKGIIRIALQEKAYLDIFSWLGPQSSEFLPSVNQDGTTNIKGVVNDNQIENIRKNILKITDNSIELKDVESLLVSKVWKNNEDSSIISVQLLGKDQTVNLYHNNDLVIQELDHLIFFKKEDFVRDLVEDTALLIPVNYQHPIYICKYNSFIKPKFISELFIDTKERKVIDKKEIIEFQKQEKNNSDSIEENGDKFLASIEQHQINKK